MLYTCSWSGGKDSTASIILAHLHNEPLDLIVMAEVMYDNVRDISGENPEHIKWVREYAKPLFESWGYKVEILRSDRDYVSNFNRIMKNPRKYMEHKGKCLGFPIGKLCHIKRDCKISLVKKYLASLGEFTQYIGIAVDEPKRLERLHNSKDISLLEKYGYTEKMAKELCEKYNLLSPSYKYTERNGCWFCPNAKLPEFKCIRDYNKELWEEFVALEKRDDIAYKDFNFLHKEKTLESIDKKLRELE